ncbi:hypothetical protein LL944_16965, partial [Lactiplantibacillus pentosus]|nr:hypothetical protein [Lactiplantibacillus pentosus]
MRTNDLVSLYVRACLVSFEHEAKKDTKQALSFVETNGGKSRPVLIRRVSEQTVEAFKITS